MQILKANNWKSITVSHLLHSCPNSICIVYNDYCPSFMYGVIYINSKEYSMDNLKEFINEEIDNLTERKDYLIVYTNKTEEEIMELVDFMNSRRAIIFREVLITCKP